MSLSSPLAIPDSVRQANRAFLAARRSLTSAIVNGARGLEIAATLSTWTDQWLLTLWEAALAESMSDRVSLVATGGYGRGELALHSDIDLLIALHDDSLLNYKPFELAIERLLAWARDIRISVGHAVRTADQTTRAIVDDLRTPIGLLDSRHLQGPPLDNTPFSPRRIVDHLRGDDRGIGFVQTLLDGLRQRAERQGKTLFLLEPDLKFGEGGLRDLNYIHWAARVRWRLDVRRNTDPGKGWQEDQAQTYRHLLGRLLTTRNQLHLLRQRSHDRLGFREQDGLARILAADPVDDAPQAIQVVDQARDAADATDTPQDDDLREAIESVMADHYRRARTVAMTCERTLRRWSTSRSTPPTRKGPFEIRRQLLSLAAPEAWHDEAVFDALALADDQNLLLDPRLETRIENTLQTWPVGDDAPAALCHRLSALLTDPKRSERTSRRLLELGIIGRIVPEFEPLICHVQHDLYHIYTTDVHSLNCLEKGRALLANDPQDIQWPQFVQIARNLDDRVLFLMACLFHDVGKNRGGQHSLKGAKLIGAVGPRLGLDDAQVDELAFLIRHHLLLSNTSRRRDITDPKTLQELADLIESPRRLARLTALTYCDMATVGPDVLNDWTASLLLDLHHRLEQVLAQPAKPATDEDRQSHHRRRLYQAVHAAQKLPSTTVDSFLDALPDDHLDATDTDALFRQFQTYCQALENDDDLGITCTVMTERGVTEMIVSSPDRPGILARIAGAIASVGLNIMSAHIVTTTSARTVDIFHVAHFNPRAVPPDSPRPVDGSRRLDRLRQRVADALLERIDVGRALERRLNEQRLTPRAVPTNPIEVRLAPQASDRFTVIEVRAPDRLGLLYTIAQTLHEQQVSTKISRIDSLGSQAIDTFYIEEHDGTCLSDQRSAQVVAAISDRLHQS